MIKQKFAVGAGIVAFLVLVTSGTATALWSTAASVSSTVETASIGDMSCAVDDADYTRLINPGFESPTAPNGVSFIAVGQVPGWNSATDDTIEFWVHNTHDSESGSNIPAAVGNQFVELNGDQPDTIFQVVDTVPGQTLQWSLMHRSRKTQNDQMQVLIGANASTASVQATLVDGRTWTRHGGLYVVPAEQTQTWFGIRAVGGGSIGNFIDDVTFGVGPCLDISSTYSNATRAGETPMEGDIVEYSTTVQNVGGAPSSGTAFTSTLPTGLAYVPGSLRVNGSDVGQLATVSGQGVTVRLGTGASASAGGALPTDAAPTVITVQATVLPAAVNAPATYTPSVGYVNALAPNWPQSVVSNTVEFTPVERVGTDLDCTASGSNENRGVTCGVSPVASGTYTVEAAVLGTSGITWHSLGTITNGQSTIVIDRSDVNGLSNGQYNIRVRDAAGALVNNAWRITVGSGSYCTGYSFGSYCFGGSWVNYSYPTLTQGATTATLEFSCFEYGSGNSQRIGYAWNLAQDATLAFQARRNSQWSAIGPAAGVAGDAHTVNIETSPPRTWPNGTYDVRVSGATELTDDLQVRVTNNGQRLRCS